MDGCTLPSMKTTRPQLILILGIHRSGTSALGNILCTLGVSCGPESELIGVASDNPKGFFEHKAIVNINAKMLGMIGASWKKGITSCLKLSDSLSLLLSDVVCSMMLKSLCSNVTTSLDYHAKGTLSYFVKDPRLCLTLPLWDSLYWGDRTPLIIFTYRHPMGVALSLKKRNNITMEHSFSLYLLYVCSTLNAIKKYIENNSVLMVSSDDMISDPIQGYNRIFEWLKYHGAVKRSHADVCAEVLNKTIDPSLFHKRSCYSGVEESLTPSENILYTEAVELWQSLNSVDNSYVTPLEISTNAQKVLCESET